MSFETFGISTEDTPILSDRQTKYADGTIRCETVRYARRDRRTTLARDTKLPRRRRPATVENVVAGPRKGRLRQRRRSRAAGKSVNQPRPRYIYHYRHPSDHRRRRRVVSTPPDGANVHNVDFTPSAARQNFNTLRHCSF